jgi:predicted ATPase
MSFKIIAIRPLKKCNKKFLKNLVVNEFYTFYNNYEIAKSNNVNNINIKFEHIVPEYLYYKRNAKINISAIVGKNGSGKSSLVELLYVVIYNLSIRAKFITEEPSPLIPRNFNLTNFDFSKLESNAKTYDTAKPQKKYIEDLEEDIDSLLRLKAEIEQDLITSPKKANFKKHEILQNYNIIRENYESDDWHHKSLDFIDHQVKTFKDFKFDIERKYNLNVVKSPEKAEPEKAINADIIFENDGNLFLVRAHDKSVKIFNFKKNQIDHMINYSLNINSESLDIFDYLKETSTLFYSIINNYSLYGLNSLEIGDWITKIFHKNDGYQTPIVINPMRTKGIIDINTENYLSKSRLLSNLLSKVEGDVEESLRCLVNGKVAKTLNLEINTNKFKNERGNIEFRYLKYKDDLLYKILNAFKNYETEESTKEEIIFRFQKPSLAEEYTIEYIFRKIDKIARTYTLNRKKMGDKFNFDYPFLLDDLLSELKNNFSHVTFKLRQAVNFLRYDYSSIDKSQCNLNISISKLSDEILGRLESIIKLDIDYAQSQQINQSKSEDPQEEENKSFVYISRLKHELINFLPPSFYNLDIQFENDNGSFSDLSSGEKQNLFSISTIIYHLYNLKSISDSEGQSVYDLYNIVLDEIELYFHPDFQKSFISDLLKNIEKIEKKFDGINILFITHSPFILSDIPNSNILFLENGKPTDKKDFRTFGANIHDILADSFFMPKGYTGKFAKEKIDKTVGWLFEKYQEIKILKEKGNEKKIADYKKDMDPKEVFNHEMIMNLIDEPILRSKLYEMFNYIFSEETQREREIEELRLKAEILGFKITDKNIE